MTPVTAIIALGSNLAEPVAQIHAAVAAIDALPHTRVTAVSALYRTAPVGYTGQPDFINAVLQAETALAAADLLAALHGIEQAAGRERSFRNAPRTLDLDIIDYGGQVHDSDTLQLPHPRAFERGFVMIPLAEIAPDYRLPGHPPSAAAQAERLAAEGGVQRWQDWAADSTVE
ncbi:2-amino-4-hydroxy-6-hydroxymethyldihydropteridine diphosphokinase [Neisseria sp. HSC-16F19]|nr:2-amino-4-hydroxy-6-hydroxymethyldihydropteridine diphosphokinase [Neisseria sp. HSC-16F19]MCP2040398.1 2-amino-4-hydroxy-6-hydroxymethyldihydropteridine diphosphokinase [Neisseria sp. HSC-16F19]